MFSWNNLIRVSSIFCCSRFAEFQVKLWRKDTREDPVTVKLRKWLSTWMDSGLLTCVIRGCCWCKPWIAEGRGFHTRLFFKRITILFLSLKTFFCFPPKQGRRRVKEGIEEFDETFENANSCSQPSREDSSVRLFADDAPLSQKDLHFTTNQFKQTYTEQQIFSCSGVKCLNPMITPSCSLWFFSPFWFPWNIKPFMFI